MPSVIRLRVWTGRTDKTHGQPHPLTGNGALQEDGLPVQGLVAGNDLEGQILRPLVAVAAVSHTGDLGKYLFCREYP